MLNNILTKIASEYGTFKNNKWCFSQTQLRLLIDEIINVHVEFETKVLQDMFRERDEEIIRLQKKIEKLIDNSK
jgi:hypothetical protein